MWVSPGRICSWREQLLQRRGKDSRSAISSWNGWLGLTSVSCQVHDLTEEAAGSWKTTCQLNTENSIADIIEGPVLSFNHFLPNIGEVEGSILAADIRSRSIRSVWIMLNVRSFISHLFVEPNGAIFSSIMAIKQLLKHTEKKTWLWNHNYYCKLWWQLCPPPQSSMPLRW